MTNERPILKQFKKEVEYYHAHRDELLEQHPERWVAIFEQQVVAVAAEPERLLATLRQRQIPPERALVEHLTLHEETLIVCCDAGTPIVRGSYRDDGHGLACVM